MSRWVVLAVLALTAAAGSLPAAAQFGVSTSRDSEVKLGREVAHEVERQYPLSANEAYQERVRRIGTALIESMPEKAYPYEFKVLAASEFNAFCLPGGFMYVFEGLLTRLPDDDAVAFVMAHEIAHASHRHWRSQVEKGKSNAMLAILAGTLTGNADVASLVMVLTTGKYSRQQETDADETGMEMAWAAGFDPEGALDATRVMIDLEKGSRTPKYLRSHPKATDRLNHLEKRLEPLKTRPRPVSPAGVEMPDLASVLGRAPDVEPAMNPWFPLAIGNTWTYSVRSGETASEYTVRVAGRLPWKGGSAWRAETVFGATSVPCQWISTEEALWRRNRPSNQESPWSVEHVLGPPEGTRVERDGTTYTVAPGEPVSVPGGAFTEVLHVLQESPSRTCDLWYAKGVGLVRRTCRETGVEEVLTAYRAGSPAPETPAPETPSPETLTPTAAPEPSPATPPKPGPTAPES